jgi:hypothetical protein
LIWGKQGLLFAQAARSRVCLLPEMTTSYSCAIKPAANPLPEQFFDFAFEQLTWQSVEEHLGLDGRWTVAQAGPWQLTVRCITDHDSSLDDWTSREDSPELYEKLDRGNLYHVGLIVEIDANGLLLAQDSIWAVTVDWSNHTTTRESYEYLLLLIKELTATCLQSIPVYLDRKIQDLQHAAQVFTGLEQPYHRSVHF